MQQRDAAAVGMPQQHGLLDAQRCKQCGQHFMSLAVHVVGAQLAFAANIRHRVRLAIALPGIHDAGAAGCRANARGPVSPHRDRAQSLVQKDDGRQRPVRGLRHALNLEFHATDLKLFHGGMVRAILGA
jgi:hypothetical protein